MRNPQFIVAGTARAGTTSLNSYLIQHPEIFLPIVKEPCFFTFAGEKIDYKNGKFAFALTDIDDYSKLYKKAQQSQITGDISTPYLYLHEKTIRNIKRFHDDPESIKVIIVLRDPVDRAYSQYLWRVRDGREELSFEEAIAAESERMKQNYSFDYFYIDRGNYYEQVKAYIENFKNVKILLFEDLKNNTKETLADICKFLGVDSEFEFVKRTEQNSSFMPKSTLLNRLLTIESKTKFKFLSRIPESVKTTIKEQFMRLNSKNEKNPLMNESTRKRLKTFYKDDLLKLQKLIARDLSSWM
ncbi:MAG: sulfotransferase domain-containing protein [Bacteroidetes bacterium]|nr:sulfotransferase domain-containing protein [Bacteroidota bacterium]MBK8363249.1 sulfotransferase domain-containing protein [Bacteroidota bacterium]MBK9414985.1 sulfotransferase domain-containing protein [Bacteroidota bacterium]MBP6427292.1 sulfotransferase domain-containing protein [Bacteroidia bacterium]